MKQSFSIACFFDESTLRMVLKSLEVEEHFLQTKSHIQCRYYHIHNYVQLYLRIFSHDWWIGDLELANNDTARHKILQLTSLPGRVCQTWPHGYIYGQL